MRNLIVYRVHTHPYPWSFASLPEFSIRACVMLLVRRIIIRVQVLKMAEFVLDGYVATCSIRYGDLIKYSILDYIQDSPLHLFTNTSSKSVPIIIKACDQSKSIAYVCADRATKEVTLIKS